MSPERALAPLLPVDLVPTIPGGDMLVLGELTDVRYPGH